MAVIYKITSPSGKIYIGQSRNWSVRKNQYKNNRCKGQPKLYNSFKKYGVKAHLIDICFSLPNDVSQDVLNEYEIFYWSQYVETGYVMLNVKYPGSNGAHSEETKIKFKNRVVSEDTKKKISKSISGNNNPMFGKKGINSPNHGKLLGELNPMFGKRGNLHPLYGKTKELCANYNKKQTEEHKLKKAAAIKGSKNGMWNKGYLKQGDNNPASIKVIDLNTGVIYSCIREAAEKCNIKNGTLKDWLSGRYKNKSTLMYLRDSI